MIPLNDLGSRILRFGSPSWIRATGSGLFVLGGACLIAQFYLPEISGGIRVIVIVGGGIVFALGWMLALWSECFEMNMESGEFRYTRGFGRFRRNVSGPTSRLE